MYSFRIVWICIIYVCFFNCLLFESAYAQEICDNDIDDDADGLIDVFDPDCPTSQAGYFGRTDNTCRLNNNLQFSIQEEYQTPSDQMILTYVNPLVADLDGDGNSEIIMASSDNFVNSPVGRLYQNIRIFNGQDGSIIRTIATPWVSWLVHNTTAVGDVDGDGFGEIIIAATADARNAVDERRFLFCYERDGTLKWRSDTKYNYNDREDGANISLADFNSDGIPEIYFGNQIYNAATGVRLISGGEMANQGISREFGGAIGVSFAADILPNEPGLELVVGNQVYTVNINNVNGATGNTLTVAQALNPTSQIGDGPSAVIDFDLDGDLDIAVIRYLDSRQVCVYVWDGQTSTLIGNQPWIFNIPPGNTIEHGVVTAADIDGDCFPELVFGVENTVIALEFDNSGSLRQKWESGNINRFNGNAISFFDFDANGTQELVYRDEENLYIFDGSRVNNPITIASFGCLSGTGTEVPIIVDIDNDNEAELIAACALTNFGTVNSAIGSLRIFGSANGLDWPPARGIWNQYLYQPTVINDDLSIPIQQQNHNISYSTNNCGCNDRNWPLNTYMGQVTLMDKQGCPVPTILDTFTINLGEDLLLCQGEEVLLDAGQPGVNYTWQDGSQDSTFLVNSSGLYWVELMTASGCTKRDSIQITFQPRLTSPLDLGPDLILCTGETLVLDASQPGANYLWQDGSENPTFAVSASGTYSVSVSNNCDTLRDEVRIDFLPSPTVDLGNDVLWCSSEQLILDVTQSGATYLWQDSSRASTFTVTEPGLYWVEVAIGNDCVARDSIQVNAPVDIGTEFSFDSPQSFCQGDTVIINAGRPGATYLWQDGSTENFIRVAEPGVYSVTLTNGCDTLSGEIQINFDPLPVLNLGNDTLLCRGDQLLLDVSQAGATYIWQDGSREGTFLVNQEGTYSVRLNLGACTVSDEIFVAFELCKDRVLIPNTITPNGDGVNDRFIIEGLELNNWILEIYNRQGLELYNSDNYQNDWRGGDHPSAVYFYILKEKAGNCTFRGWLNVLKE